MQVMFVQKT